MIRMIAKNGKCAFCHKFFIVGRETIIYDPNLHKAFHEGCPNQVIQEPKQQNILPPPPPLIPQRQNIMSVKTKTDHIESQVLPDLTLLFDGKFAIPCQLKDGTQTHLSLRIDTVKEGYKYAGSRRIRVHFGRHDGQKFIDVSFITTDNRYIEYKSFKYETEMTDEKKNIVREAVKLLLQGQENAVYALEYARICRRCWHCNMDLTNIHTLEQLEKHSGLGPVCYKKYPHLRNRIDQTVIETPVRVLSL